MIGTDLELPRCRIAEDNRADGRQNHHVFTPALTGIPATSPTLVRQIAQRMKVGECHAVCSGLCRKETARRAAESQ